jgi:hypothetical protein
MKKMNITIIITLISFTLFAPNNTTVLSESKPITVYLDRTYTQDMAMGKLIVPTSDSVHIFKTLELPWRMNRKNISCIPQGEYKVYRCDPNEAYPYYHYKLIDVEGREYILIHIGFKIEHTEGCILLQRQDLKAFNRLGLPEFVLKIV